MANIDEGYGIIAGRGRDNAQKALAAAHAAGLEPTVVRTVAEGYLVPEAVLVQFEKASAEEADESPAKAAPKAAPKKATKKSAPKSEDTSEEAPAESETDKKGE